MARMSFYWVIFQLSVFWCSLWRHRFILIIASRPWVSRFRSPCTLTVWSPSLMLLLFLPFVLNSALNKILKPVHRRLALHYNQFMYVHYIYVVVSTVADMSSFHAAVYSYPTITYHLPQKHPKYMTATKSELRSYTSLFRIPNTNVPTSDLIIYEYLYYQAVRFLALLIYKRNNL